MKTIAPAVLGAAVIASPSLAGFTGWTALSRTSGSVLLVDVLANFSDANARALNVWDANITVTGASFLQQATLQRKGWAPAADQGPDDHDSFMTLGHVDELGITYVGQNVHGDPSFTSTPGAWNGTISSAPSMAVPTNAGWYCVPTSAAPGQVQAIDLDSIENSGLWQHRTGTHGVWVAHFAFDLASIAAGARLSFAASVGYRPDALPGNPIVGLGSSQFLLTVPTPGVSIAMLVFALGGRSRRRKT